MHENPPPPDLLDHLAQARHALADAKQRNAVARRSGHQPPFSPGATQQLENAVRDIAEEAYGADPQLVGAGARRMLFPAGRSVSQL